MRIRGNNRRIQHSGIFASFLVAAFAVAMVAAPIFKSSADEFDVGVNVNSVISLSLSSDSATIDAPIGGGFGSDSTDAIVLTNSAFGYTLAIEDADSNTSLTSSASEDVVTSDYLGSKTSETFEANTWGFSFDGAKFYAIPQKNSPLILSTSSVATPDEGAETTITFGAKTSASLTSGTYTDRIIISAYTNGVDGEPEGVDPTSNPPEEVSDDIPEPYDEGEGPNENKLVLLTSMQDKRLHRYCEETYTPTSAGSSYVETRYFDGDYIPRALVVDKRDGQKYLIAKYADGKCWMNQNLRIINRELSSDLSDLPSGTTWTVPASINSNTWNSTLNANVAYIDSVDSVYGGLYSFYALTAGWGTNGVTSGNSPQSICAKGWRLPTGGADGDFQALYTAMGNHRAIQVAGLFQYAGVKYGPGVEARGQQGRYWSSTVKSANEVYYMMHYLNNYTYPQYSTNKWDGNAARCIAR